MKTRVRNEQTRCRVAGGEKSFVLYFLFLEPVLNEPVVSVCRTTEGYQAKKNRVFEPFNLRLYFENFKKALLKNN